MVVARAATSAACSTPLGEQEAIFVGHDWGASLVWQLATLHPERVRAVAGLSVPFVPRAPAPPLPIMRRHLGEDFYIVWFQQPGVADEALARDVRRTLTTSRQWTAQWAEEDGQPAAPSGLAVRGGSSTSTSRPSRGPASAAG